MNVAAPCLPFDVCLAVWGAVYIGDTAERTACMAEGDRDSNQAFGRMWDRTARSLKYELIVDRHGRRTPPLWWALPYLTQHILRGHAVWDERPHTAQEEGTDA